jgi:hypothetical protein
MASRTFIAITSCVLECVIEYSSAAWSGTSFGGDFQRDPTTGAHTEPQREKDNETSRKAARPVTYTHRHDTNCRRGIVTGMDIETARNEFEAGQLTEAVVEPLAKRNGWVVMVRRRSGELIAITTHGGLDKVYHDLDHATGVARDIGFHRVRVEEAF